MYSRYAFVDEAGNYGFKFDKQNVSKHFIVTAILVDAKKLSNVRKKIEEVRKKYFQTGELKSRQLNTSRRKRIFKDLKSIDFNIYAVVVNKEKLRQDGGFRYHKSFYKYINGLLYKDLFGIHSGIQVRADQYGDSKFMKEFEKYINERHISDLFSSSLFTFVKSSDDVLIQLADFIGGTILRKYESNIPDYDYLLQKLSNKIIRIESWPYSDLNKVIDKIVELDSQYDKDIANYSVKTAHRFVKDNANSKDLMIRDRVNFLKYLLTHLSLGQNRYIYSQEIKSNIQTFNMETQERKLTMREIVGPLRDEGLLIASSSKGYKLATSSKDLVDYVDFSSSMIIPMLHRIDKCRNIILTLTENKLDILDGDKYRDLQNFFDTKHQRQ